MSRLSEQYKVTVVPELMKKFGLTNPMAVPKITKVVVSMGVGKATENKKRMEDAVKDLATITGQKPLVTRARKSVSGFKVRGGNEIGCMVTLRGQRMYEFMDRLISLTIPRIRDFRGFPATSFDGNGNYNMGLSDQLVFSEIDMDKTEFTQGMNVTFRITGGNDDASRELLRLMGFPFTREEPKGKGQK